MNNHIAASSPRELPMNVFGKAIEFLLSLSHFPISPDDVRLGRTDILSSLDNVPELMLPLRRLSHLLAKVTDTLSTTPEEYPDAWRFAKSLTHFVEERHGFDNPEIFRVTPATTTSAFRENLKFIEPIHPFSGDADLQVRMNHPDRAIYAWRDPYNPDFALASIQVARADILADKIDDILVAKRRARNPRFAIPYSVSNWKRVAAAGQPFIYAVAKVIREEMGPDVRIVTLSPMSGFADVIREAPFPMPRIKALLNLRAIQYLLFNEKKDNDWVMKNGTADFHMRNGAVLVRVCPDGNPRDKSALGYMANYEYGSNQQLATNAAEFQAGRPVRHPDIQQILLNA